MVAFDLDGTLTTRDCVVPFLRRVAGTPRLLAGLSSHPIGVTRAVARRDRDTLKSFAANAAFSGRSLSRVTAEASDFAAAVVARRLRADTVQTLQAHQQAGDTVVLVSASFEIYLRPLGGLLGVDGVLGARLAAEDDVLTGALDGPNCRGPEKVRRLHDWLCRHVGGRDAVELIAYGDSAGDRELLAAADTAHWVGSYRP